MDPGANPKSGLVRIKFGSLPSADKLPLAVEEIYHDDYDGAYSDISSSPYPSPCPSIPDGLKEVKPYLETPTVQIIHLQKGKEAHLVITCPNILRSVNGRFPWHVTVNVEPITRVLTVLLTFSGHYARPQVAARLWSRVGTTHMLPDGGMETVRAAVLGARSKSLRCDLNSDDNGEIRMISGSHRVPNTYKDYLTNRDVFVGARDQWNQEIIMSGRRDYVETSVLKKEINTRYKELQKSGVLVGGPYARFYKPYTAVSHPDPQHYTNNPFVYPPASDLIGSGKLALALGIGEEEQICRKWVFDIPEGWNVHSGGYFTSIDNNNRECTVVFTRDVHWQGKKMSEAVEVKSRSTSSSPNVSKRRANFLHGEFESASDMGSPGRSFTSDSTSGGDSTYGGSTGYYGTGNTSIGGITLKDLNFDDIRSEASMAKKNMDDDKLVKQPTVDVGEKIEESGIMQATERSTHEMIMGSGRDGVSSGAMFEKFRNLGRRER